MCYVNNNLSNKVGGISNIRATDGGNITSFRSNDSKIGQYIDVNSERVVINYMENGEWKTGFALASKSDLTQYITVEKTTDAYGQISLDKAYNIKSLFCMGDRRFASLVGDINVRITDSTGDAIKNTPVKVIVGYKS